MWQRQNRAHGQHDFALEGGMKISEVIRSNKNLKLALSLQLRETAVAAIAQLGERQTEDLKVPGSIPGLGMSCSLCQLNGSRSAASKS